MKKEIKFRGWMPKEKAMVYEVSVADKPITNLDLFFKETADDGFVWMQYTGLKDKNGKEIWEGDIFAEHRVKEEDEPFGEVYFDEDLSAFCVRKANGGWVYLSDFILEEKRSSVIGNIYENPELLN